MSCFDGHAAEWVNLVPELAELVEAGGRAPGASPAMERRRSHDAVAVVLARAVSRRPSPVLLTIDDLQEGSAATVDLLGYLGRRLGPVRPCCSSTAIRSDDIARVVGPGRRRDAGAAQGPAGVRRAGAGGGGRPVRPRAGRCCSGPPVTRSASSSACAPWGRARPAFHARSRRRRSGCAPQRLHLEPQTRRVLELACVAGGRGLDALRARADMEWT